MKTGTQKGRGKIKGRKERKKKIQLHLRDSNPQPLAYMTRALPLVLRGSLKWKAAEVVLILWKSTASSTLKRARTD